MKVIGPGQAGFVNIQRKPKSIRRHQLMDEIFISVHAFAIPALPRFHEAKRFCIVGPVEIDFLEAADQLSN